MTDSTLADAYLEQSPACHWIVDRDLVFRRIYGDAAPILGKTATELVGRRAAEALEPELAAAWADRVARALAGEVLMLRERTGGRTWNISVFPIRMGATAYAGALAREVTQWNRADQDLRHTVLGALKAMEF